MNNQPNPGSKEAVAAGCTCPVMDNARGRGAWGSSGEDAIFYRNDRCPLHGKNTQEKAND